MTVLVLIAGVLFAVAALLALVRVIRGPSIVDRVIASDVLLTTLILIVGAQMVVTRTTYLIPLMVVLAASAIFGTVAVARFVTRTDPTAFSTVPPDTTQAGRSGARRRARKAAEREAGGAS